MFVKKLTACFLLFSITFSQLLTGQNLAEVAPKQERNVVNRYNLGGSWSSQAEGGLGDFSAGYFPGAVMIPVNLWGAAKTTGLFKVPKNTTLSTLLSYARGPTDDAQLDEIKIKRVAGDKEKTFTVDVEQMIEKPGQYDVVLQPNDIVYLEPKRTFIDPRLVYLVAFIASIASIGVAGVTIYDRTK